MGMNPYQGKLEIRGKMKNCECMAKYVPLCVVICKQFTNILCVSLLTHIFLTLVSIDDSCLYQPLQPRVQIK